jgi:hypothetical protein
MAKNESEFAVHLTINGELVSVLPGEDIPKGFEVTNELVTKPAAKDEDDDEKPAPRRGRAAKGSDES